jgi:preprotein translocase subunit YajC
MLITPAYAAAAIPAAAPAQAPVAASGMDAILQSPLPMMVLIGILFYFMIFRPQQKRMNEQKAMLAAVAKGDEVVTNGGVLGRVTKAGEQYLTIEIADGVEVVIQRSAIAAKLEKGTVKAQR